MPNKPIAVTMGEPSGIASEIILKTWLSRKKNKIHPFFLIDDLKKLEKIRVQMYLLLKGEKNNGKICLERPFC